MSTALAAALGALLASAIIIPAFAIALMRAKQQRDHARRARDLAIDLSADEISSPDIMRTQRMVHETAVAKGWWDNPAHALVNGDGTVNTHVFLAQVALVMSELGEAVEHLRKVETVGELKPWKHPDGKPDGVAIELADVVIRCMNIAGASGINLAEAIALKATFNKLRPARHGGKRA